jgi:heme/copper-type cytochrome/quinol oxidase subunit 2
MLIMKSTSIFQINLNFIVILVSVIIRFFILTVLLSIGYVLWHKVVTHYIGHKKANAEGWAFLFSSLALLAIRYPSISLLFEYRRQTNVRIIIKVVGAQWYWTFEIADIIEDAVCIYIISTDDLLVGDLRLLDVDNRLVVPVNILVQFNVTSSDVIHSFALPTLGVKVDATAGLLTIVPAWTTRRGVHYGQCSEICGINHAFIPFVIEIVSHRVYVWWFKLYDKDIF